MGWLYPNLNKYVHIHPKIDNFMQFVDFKGILWLFLLWKSFE